METAVRESLGFSLVPEVVDSGSPEERSCFGMLSVRIGNSILTEGVDQHSSRSCDGPLVSGYHFAEWLAWNWWRLRWEWWYRQGSPEQVVCDWEFAHSMSAIGEGYAWPNLTIASDGYQTAIVSDPTHDDRAIFRYISGQTILIPAKILESAIDHYMSSILTRLDGDGIQGTNLQSLWSELTAERQQSETAFFRRMEARLGCDPDELDQSALRSRWLGDADRFGTGALEELASHVAYTGAQSEVMSADHIIEIAYQNGFDADRRDAVGLDLPDTEMELGDVEAWRVGEERARRLQLQEGLDAEKRVSNELLASLAGVTERALLDPRPIGEMSFFLNDGDFADRVVLASSWETGRRFALARLVGDRLFGWEDSLYPATRSYSYRQKAQRAFAAELLSPFEAVNNMLGADDSEERQNEIAQHYNVSPRTIESMLVNKGRISREEAAGIVSQNHSWVTG